MKTLNLIIAMNAKPHIVLCSIQLLGKNNLSV